MKRIHLSINGRDITGRMGETLLEVAHDHEVFIPTLCNFPGLASLGACRVCIVEVEGYPRPLPACATAAEQGMVLRTDSDKIRKARRMIVELLLAERNHACPVCVMDGCCELQSLAKLLGIDHVRYGFIAPQMTVDASQSRFGIDHNRCILCRRCVRVCDEIEGAHTWDVGGRGSESRIISDLAEPWGKSETCTDCGKCVQTCPTGALFQKGAEKARNEPVCLERLVAWRGRKHK
jgi:bidirectional [NiFe] hydrogenase diaphorase subunit